jgi:hypothetical protein
MRVPLVLQGVVAETALLAANPAGPAASVIHHWKYVTAPLGMLAGHVPGRSRAPALVDRPSRSRSGFGTITPPLKGAFN